ncbi:TlpA disulfide reductase family protein [Pedobacter sp. KR3-3]|uniref:TlpA disulfide reductase family protein n=1 Tax=Pedobacter albus TaxID=3113905 RepID=A0ABU7I4M2_9SPHI|nr:TlpA disulfide reductase family protein [Pedobacter sp. KR3-3]MEE1944414.1 TlpA disulfide reductase family protein [Pedobacter sp. KR3-3]
MRYLLAIIFFFAIAEANAQVKLLSLSQLEQRVARGKDTTYVVNFWATWCGPCVEELPNFEKLQQQNQGKPLKVLLVSLDFKSKLQKEVVPFVLKNKIKSEVYVINEPDQQQFIEKVDPKWSGAIPATLFINTKRQLRTFYEKEFTYQELTKTLANLK